VVREKQDRARPVAWRRWCGLPGARLSDAPPAPNAWAASRRRGRGGLTRMYIDIGLVQNLQDMGGIVVTQRNGTPIFVRDLGMLRLSS
jgi:cobalt-zinc-cadmium resistance protein CzcA